MKIGWLLVAASILAGSAPPSWAQAPNPTGEIPPNPCGAAQPDRTAEVQALVDAAAQPGAPAAQLAPGALYCINGRVGINVPSNVRLELRGASLVMKPGCGTAGFVCRLLNLMPGAVRVEILGPGFIDGDDTPSCATCWSILVRVDGAEATLRRLTLRRSRSDLIWIGGGVGGTKASALIDQVQGERAGRNLVSVVHAREVLITRSIFKDAYGPNPGACFDGEPNPGDTIERLVILLSRFEDCRLGVVNQKGQGNQGQGFILAWNTIAGIRSPKAGTPGTPTGVVVNGVIGAVLFENDIFMPVWPGYDAVPLAGTIAGNSIALAATDAFFLHNRIEGNVHDRGTLSEIDDVYTGDWRYVNVRNLAAIGNTIRNGRFTQAGEGVVGDDMRLRNSVTP